MLDDLRKIELFAELSPEEMEILRKRGKQVSFKKGDVIIARDDPNDTLMIILDGTIRVILLVEGRELILASLEEGDTLGELSFIDPGPSSATCRAISDGTLFTLSRGEMETMIGEHAAIGVKIYHSLAKELKRRLNRTNDNLADFFNISRTLTENEQFRTLYGTCFR